MKITMDTTLHELNTLTVEEISLLLEEPEMLALAGRIGDAEKIANIRNTLLWTAKSFPGLYDYLKDNPQELETAVNEMLRAYNERYTDDTELSILYSLFPQFTEED